MPNRFDGIPGYKLFYCDVCDQYFARHYDWPFADDHASAQMQDNGLYHMRCRGVAIWAEHEDKADVVSAWMLGGAQALIDMGLKIR